MTYLLDTWVWIEYFLGTDPGRRMTPLIESWNHATSILTVAELSDVYHRLGAPGIDDRLAFVQRSTEILPLDPSIAHRAGATKQRQRDAGRSIGLVDALIYETARAHGLTLLSGDLDFEGLDGVEMVDEPGGA